MPKAKDNKKKPQQKKRLKTPQRRVKNELNPRQGEGIGVSALPPSVATDGAPKTLGRNRNMGSIKAEIQENNSEKDRNDIITAGTAQEAPSGDSFIETAISGDQAVDNGKDQFKIIFSWETVDFIKTPKTELYFTAAVLASMGMILWGFSTKSFTVILTFIMVAVVSIMVLNESPRKMKVKVTEDGIDINEEHFDYRDFRSFKVSRMHDMEVLSLYRKEKYILPKMIYVENEPVKDLCDFLGIYLPEEEG